MDIKTYLYYLIKVLLTPRCWLQNSKFLKDWDQELLARIKQGYKFKLTDFGGYSADIGGEEIWIENHPYASFTTGKNGKGYEFGSDEHNIRPARTTILYARDVLEKHCPEVTSLQAKRKK